MKNIKKMIKNLKSITIVALASIVVLSSCEEVIEIDLNSSNPVLVAEGVMEKDSTIWIRLNYTTDYFNNEEPVVEKNATVTLVNENDELEILTYTENGIYKGDFLVGEVGETYTIGIITDKGEFSAGSTLMPPSSIYGLIVSESNMQPPGQTDKSYSLEIKFKDVSTAENFYMMKLFVNNEFYSYALVNNKIFTVSGDTITYPVIRKTFLKNDEVIVILHTVDAKTYKYYNQLSDAISDGMGPGGSSTPYNPTSNFGDDVLGYFAAWSYVTDTVIIE